METRISLKEAVLEYDPQVHGTIKEYCQSRGIRYQSFINRRNKDRYARGEEPQRREYMEPYFSLFNPQQENMKSFCARMGINYDSFKNALKREGIPHERSHCRSSKYDVLLDAYNPDRESLHAFCLRNGLNFESFKATYYRKKHCSVPKPPVVREPDIFDLFEEKKGFAQVIIHV